MYKLVINVNHSFSKDIISDNVLTLCEFSAMIVSLWFSEMIGKI